MIVVPVLYGGIGNNLFEISCAIAYSLKHKINYCIPSEIDNPHYKGQQVFFSKYINYCYCNIGTLTLNTSAELYKEKHYHYSEIPPPQAEVTILDGYWQSAKYIEPYKEEVLEILDILFEPRPDICSIHVRRGDYLKYPTVHPPVTKEYLRDAQKYMMERGFNKFFVCSDDIEWCMNEMPQFLKYGDDKPTSYIFSTGRSETEDLSLAAGCGGHIGSNSSFSYWVYYLNPNIGVFPRVWYGKDLPHDTKDLIMPEMILL